MKLSRGQIEEGETGFKNIHFITKEPINEVNYSFTENGKEINKTATYFLFRSNETNNSQTVEMDKEELKGAWFEYEEALKKGTHWVTI